MVSYPCIHRYQDLGHFQSNLEIVGAPRFTGEEQAFAKEIQKAIGKEETGLHAGIAPVEEPRDDKPMGSTDVADVSWNVPVAGFGVCAPT